MKHFFLTLLWSAISATAFAVAVLADPEARALLAQWQDRAHG